MLKEMFKKIVKTLLEISEAQMEKQSQPSRSSSENRELDPASDAAIESMYHSNKIGYAQKEFYKDAF